MAAKDALGQQWSKGSDLMARQLDNLFNLDNPEDNEALADYGDKGMLPDYENKSNRYTKKGTSNLATENNLPPSKPQPGLQRGEFGRNNEPAPVPGNAIGTPFMEQILSGFRETE